MRKIVFPHFLILLPIWVDADLPGVMTRVGCSEAQARRWLKGVLEPLGHDTDWRGRYGNSKRQEVKRAVQNWLINEPIT